MYILLYIYVHVYTCIGFPERPSKEGSYSARIPGHNYDPSTPNPPEINTLEIQKNDLKTQLIQNEQEKQNIINNKNIAIHAINQAKTELLLHSLELMLKSNLITNKQKNDLLNMYNNNTTPITTTATTNSTTTTTTTSNTSSSNTLIDTVIDAYANNRDIHEFMSSLQMLATYASGELDYLLQDNDSGTGEGLGQSLPPMTPSGSQKKVNESNTTSNIKPPLPPTTTTTTTTTTNPYTTATTNTNNSTTNSILSDLTPTRQNRRRKMATSLAGPEPENFLKREQIDLSRIILEVHKGDVITAAEASFLLGLVKAGDRVILDSYEALL